MTLSDNDSQCRTSEVERIVPVDMESSGPINNAQHDGHRNTLVPEYITSHIFLRLTRCMDVIASLTDTFTKRSDVRFDNKHITIFNSAIIQRIHSHDTQPRTVRSRTGAHREVRLTPVLIRWLIPWFVIRYAALRHSPTYRTAKCIERNCIPFYILCFYILHVLL